MKCLKLLLLAIVLLAPLKVSNAKPTPARWWPDISRPKSSESEDAPNKGNVKAIQYLLRARGQKVKVDGVFGKLTEKEIANFQRRNKLIAKGEMNTPTWEALVMPCKTGSTGDAVRALQTLLRGAEYDVPVNGKFGPATRAAVVKYQKVSGLDGDGIAGKQTWCKLVGGGLGEQEGD